MSAPVLVRARLAGLDRARGAAIVAMVVQHTLLLLHGPNAWESTGGRLVAPVFLVVGGALVTRLSRRHLHVVALGVALSVVVPWAGAPSVLLYYVAGAALVWACRRVSPGLLWLPLLLSLAMYANGYGVTPGGQYSPLAALGLMCAGSLIGRAAIARVGDRLPSWSWLELVGRRPLAVYAGHLLLLEGVRTWS